VLAARFGRSGEALRGAFLAAALASGSAPPERRRGLRVPGLVSGRLPNTPPWGGESPL
jgi:hypothetical protein